MFTNVVKLQVPNGWEAHVTDGLLLLLGLDDGLYGVWLESGIYIGDRAINFAGIKPLQIHLEQLNTTGNYVDGAPSRLLANVGLGRRRCISHFQATHNTFGDTCGETAFHHKLLCIRTLTLAYRSNHVYSSVTYRISSGKAFHAIRSCHQAPCCLLA